MFSISESITRNIEGLLKKKNLDSVTIKFGGDGTRCCRNVTLVNFVYTIFEDPDCLSYLGQHTIGIGEIKEDYESLEEPSFRARNKRFYLQSTRNRKIE